jgi:dTDP-4-dehydrorhamnose 3,5-epimerase
LPAGFAHGLHALSESADLPYKMTDYYAPEHERSLAWNDLSVGVQWPLAGKPPLLAKDLAGKPLGECEVFEGL